MTKQRKPQSAAPGSYKIVAKGDSAEIYLYDQIGESFWGGGISAQKFAEDLKALGNVKNIDLRINSPGGSVFDGQAIYSLLVAHPASITAHIDGMALSAASFIAMAAHKINIAAGAFVMIHNAHTMAWGGAEDLRKTADLLESINSTIADKYQARTNQSAEQIKSWMDAETWFTGAEAKEHGFADEVVANRALNAVIQNPEQFKNMPAALREQIVDNADVVPGRLLGVAALTLNKEESDMNDQPNPAKPASPAENQPANTAPAPQPTSTATPAAEPVDAVKAERERCLEIQNTVRSLNLGENVASELINSGVSIEAARKRMLDMTVENAKASKVRPQHTGTAPSNINEDGPVTEEQLRAQWDANAALRAEFNNKFKAYHAFKRAEAAGTVKILKQSA